MKPLRSTQANALLITLFFVTVLTAFITVAYQLTSNTARTSRRSTEMNSAYAVADGAIELLYARWRYAMKSTSTNLNVAQLTSGDNPWGSDITDIDLTELLGSDDGAAAPYTINAIKLTHVDIYGRPQPASDAIDPSKEVTKASDPVYFSASPVGAGFSGFNIIYEAKVWVTSNVSGTIDAAGKVKGSPVTVGVKRYFTKGVSPTMQAAIFYENQLELHPGSNMLISGLVHTNDNLYACGYAGDAGNSILTFGGQVSHVGYYNQDGNGARMMTDPDRGSKILNEDTQLSKPSFANGADLQQTARMSVGGVDPDDLHADNAAPGATYNDDSYREVIERPVHKATNVDPDSLSTTPYDEYYDADPKSIASQRLYNQASLKILLKADAEGAMQVEVRRATPKGMADGPLVKTDSLFYKNIVKAINPGATNVGVKAGPRLAVPDLRESTSTDVKVSVVDVAKLKAAIATDAALHPGMLSTDEEYFNGVLYISDVTGSDAKTGSYNDVVNANATSQRLDTEMAGGQRVKHGIMLTNASEAPQNSRALDVPATDRFFTLASDNAVYVKGDFNTGGYGKNVPTNVNPDAEDTWNKGNALYTPVTAAIMADAVAVVSNLFDPTKARAGINDLYTDDPGKIGDPLYVTPGTKFQSTNPNGQFYVPPGGKYEGREVAGQFARGAEPTTINSAIVSGYTPTQGKTVSSGGAQNLIRLLENWSDPTNDPFDPVPIDFTYKGSLMQSFISKEFTGSWAVRSGGMTNYANPNRQVRFDSSFLTAPPKATPSTIVYVRGTWERFVEPIPAS